MSSTNKTTYYELSQYVGSDKPTYLGDYNDDMLKIDNGLHATADAADTALTTANTANSAATTASTTASTALSTAQSASTVASQAQTTAETALTNAGSAQTAAEGAETAARANTITNLAPAYDPSHTYDVDDLVTYIDSQGSGKMYKCIVAVTTPEAFNINKWDDVTVSDVLYKSSVVAHHRALTTETYQAALNDLFSSLTINRNKEYLFVEITPSVTKILHSANIAANSISFFMTEITSGTVAIWDYLISNSSLAHRATINGTGYTDTSYTNNNWSSERDLYIIELATIVNS